MNKYGLVIHGGAGTVVPSGMSPATEQAYHGKLREALYAGYRCLSEGRPALDAVVAAIRVMEDSPLFNAGHGAVMNAEGICELDASIMDGATLSAGAVAAVQRIRNPIEFARTVMEKSQHVMLVGVGAERFAEKLGYQLVSNDYFRTARRQRQLDAAKALEAQKWEGDPHSQRVSFVTVDDNDFPSEEKFGTVGCAALDQFGHLAAGTSTGGMTNKKFGRVGDSPLIGAGTYANDQTCAVSSTGHGEYFIRAVIGHTVSANIEYSGVSLQEGARAAIDKVGRLGGAGGLIAIDRAGNIALPFNTPGMYRGYWLSGGEPVTAMYGPPA